MMNPALAAVVHKIDIKTTQGTEYVAFNCDVTNTFRIFKENSFRISYALHTKRSLERDKIYKNFIKNGRQSGILHRVPGSSIH